MGRRRSWGWCSVLVAVLLVTAACGVAGPQSAARDADVPPVHAVLVSTPPIVLVPSTIDYTGKTDVTAPLQNFLDHLPDDRIVLFHRNGRYRVEGTLFVTDHTDLTFNGQNATIYATTQGTLTRSQWYITDGGGIVFENMIVRGANPHAGLSDKAYNPAFEKQHGFQIEGVQGIELDHVTVTDVYGDFVYIARALDQSANDVWVHNSSFARNGRQGISVVSATNVIIENNSFTDTRRATVDLEPNGPNQTDSNVFILNNSVGPGRLFFIASHGKGPVSNIVISGNALHGHLMNIDDVPPTGERRQDWIVTNNTSDVVAKTRPMRFMSTDGVLVQGNSQPMTAKVPAVEMDNVCTGVVQNNAFGTAGVLRHGTTCKAQLVIPTVPVIPGRP